MEIPYAIKRQWFFKKKWLVLKPKLYYICKYSKRMNYGGPEEGGWWFNSGNPQWRYSIPVPFWEELSYAICRRLNDREHDRQTRENKWKYTDVNSYQDNFYEYGHSDTFVPTSYPEYRPHYE